MIPRELIKKLRKIEIRTSKLANDQLAGGYHSVFKGRGMAFAEVRQYQPGDDVRFIDWNVSARMNETYVKVFTEEREMTVMLLVDLSGSERFGSVQRPKIETVAEVSALLAFSAIKNNDRVGLILFTDRVEKYVPPKKGKGHVMRVVTEILNARPLGEGTDLSVALELLGHVARRKSVAFLVSDFIADEYERAMRIASARHDLIPIQVIDPREEELPDVGLALLEDLETGDVIEVDTSNPGVRRAYQRRVARQKQLREELFRRLSVDSITVQTDRDYVRPLSDLFRRREKRMKGYG
ncbi:MAG: DUF58 domain-containing protein [Sandaracinaceae bacterium]|nr:DUF58 domain-containing protein [Sandaracinaceae bacterium]